MRVQDQEVKFNVFKAMKLPENIEDCFQVKVLDKVVGFSIQDDELEYYPIDVGELSTYSYARTCDVDFVRCAKVLILMLAATFARVGLVQISTPSSFSF
ncbi:DNA-directed DNA polymerase [Senna tora]|uniref:DNA-directed DNA polymerase n=1 Tax=Senna tora TaxID=362788 RepID=A0A834TGR9_9FABA|nr:DNA-directed DNA polymerase [Senna tora]